MSSFQGRGQHPDLGTSGPQVKGVGTMSWIHNYWEVLGFLISPNLLLVLHLLVLPPLPPFLQDLCPLGLFGLGGMIESMALVS